MKLAEGEWMLRIVRDACNLYVKFNVYVYVNAAGALLWIEFIIVYQTKVFDVNDQKLLHWSFTSYFVFSKMWLSCVNFCDFWPNGGFKRDFLQPRYYLGFERRRMELTQKCKMQRKGQSWTRTVMFKVLWLLYLRIFHCSLRPELLNCLHSYEHWAVLTVKLITLLLH